MFAKKFLSRTLIKKVPEVTIIFWVTKLLTTALGESTSDFLVHTINPIIAVIFGAIGFCIAIILQFWVKKYIPWIYWLTVTMVAIFGTMAADIVHIVLGIPYLISTIGFAVTLGVIFFIWYTREKTLSIHSIKTPGREIFYWLTVITTFALGTALGDMAAVTLNLGYLLSGILFGVLFLLPLLVYKSLKKQEVFLFWASYIVTRPLGASFADWFGRTKDMGGIGIGTQDTSLILTICILICIIYITLKKK
ncbi:MAG TPA: hypothetical protein VF820_04450 [Patescibacteria group bacterium]